MNHRIAVNILTPFPYLAAKFYPNKMGRSLRPPTFKPTFQRPFRPASVISTAGRNLSSLPSPNLLVSGFPLPPSFRPQGEISLRFPSLNLLVSSFPLFPRHFPK